MSLSVSYPAGSLNVSEIQKTIFNWIESRTRGLIPSSQILWRQQSEPLPRRPCVTLKVISGPTRVGYFDDGMTFIGGPTGSQFNIGGHREMVISVQVFGSSRVKTMDAIQLAADLNTSLALTSVLQLLRAGGIAVLRRGDPSNLTALEETEYEERVQFDMTIGVAQNIIDDPGVIEHVGAITASIQSGSESQNIATTLINTESSSKQPGGD